MFDHFLHFRICDMISVGTTKQPKKASQYECVLLTNLAVSIHVFLSLQENRNDQRTHQFNF